MNETRSKSAPKKPTADVIIVLNEDGSAQVLRIPDGMTVEIRDYNVPEDWGQDVEEDGGAGDEDGEVVTDDEGGLYQSIIFKG